MRNTDTYKGFVYQKKCAFLYVLRELVDNRGVLYFRMEHPNGDDLDLIYSERIDIFQTKEVQDPDMPEYLKKMWRRYTENFRPGTKRCIGLGFIFSRNHENNGCYCALKLKNHNNESLQKIVQHIDTDPLTQFQVKSQDDWTEFLGLISINVLDVEELHSELRRYLKFMFLFFRLPGDEVESMEYDFLGRLDEVMAGGKKVPMNDIWEVIDLWFRRYAEYLPPVRKILAEIFHEKAQAYSDLKQPIPPPNEDGTL